MLSAASWEGRNIPKRSQNPPTEELEDQADMRIRTEARTEGQMHLEEAEREEQIVAEVPPTEVSTTKSEVRE